MNENVKATCPECGFSIVYEGSKVLRWESIPTETGCVNGSSFTPCLAFKRAEWAAKKLQPDVVRRLEAIHNFVDDNSFKRSSAANVGVHAYR